MILILYFKPTYTVTFLHYINDLNTILHYNLFILRLKYKSSYISLFIGILVYNFNSAGPSTNLFVQQSYNVRSTRFDDFSDKKDYHFQNEKNFFEHIDEHRKLQYDYKLT